MFRKESTNHFKSKREKEENIRNVLILIVILCTDSWENMALRKKGKIQYI